MMNHRSTSLKNLYLRIPSQHEPTDVWQDPPEAYTRPRSCPAVLMKGTGDWTTAFGPASPTPRQNLAASQPASPNRSVRQSQVLQNHNKILFGASFSLADLFAPDNTQRWFPPNLVYMRIHTNQDTPLRKKEPLPLTTILLRRTSSTFPYP